MSNIERLSLTVELRALGRIQQSSASLTGIRLRTAACSRSPSAAAPPRSTPVSPPGRPRPSGTVARPTGRAAHPAHPRWCPRRCLPPRPARPSARARSSATAAASSSPVSSRHLDQNLASPVSCATSIRSACGRSSLMRSSVVPNLDIIHVGRRSAFRAVPSGLRCGDVRLDAAVPIQAEVAWDQSPPAGRVNQRLRHRSEAGRSACKGYRDDCGVARQSRLANVVGEPGGLRWAALVYCHPRGLADRPLRRGGKQPVGSSELASRVQAKVLLCDGSRRRRRFWLRRAGGRCSRRGRSSGSCGRA